MPVQCSASTDEAGNDIAVGGVQVLDRASRESDVMTSALLTLGPGLSPYYSGVASENRGAEVRDNHFTPCTSAAVHRAGAFLHCFDHAHSLNACSSLFGVSPSVRRLALSTITLFFRPRSAIARGSMMSLRTTSSDTRKCKLLGARTSASRNMPCHKGH